MNLIEEFQLLRKLKERGDKLIQSMVGTLQCPLVANAAAGYEMVSGKLDSPGVASNAELLKPGEISQFLSDLDPTHLIHVYPWDSLTAMRLLEELRDRRNAMLTPVAPAGGPET